MVVLGYSTRLALLDSKLRMLVLGCSEGISPSTVDDGEVIALLVDAVHYSCHNIVSTT